jgi:uncharacterized protein (TIGR00369 family)
MSERAIQDDYPKDVAHCYGCGRLNEEGLHFRGFRDGDETVCRFRPRHYHTAVPGYVYGGLIASLIDCHATGSAAAEAGPGTRFVTANLNVDFLAPTPIDAELEARARIEEVKGRKIVVRVTVRAGTLECARGRVVCVRMPEDLVEKLGS